MAISRDSAFQRFSLEGHAALVTGAASGIGKATARLFAAAGARVAVADINLPGAQAVAADLRQSGVAIAIAMDIADEGSVQAGFEAVRAELGPVDLCINNAAYRPKAPFMTMPVEEWERMHAVIARGTFLCMRTAIQGLLDAGRGGAIVNISSVTAITPGGLGNVHYESAKAGVDAMTRAAAAAYGPSGIRVNAIRPGATETEGSKTLRADTTPGAPSKFSPEAGRVVLARKADPSEMAHAILFLASPAASYITGQCLNVDGGFSVG